MVRHPNILWLVVDALRFDRCGCYGYPKQTTPTLDRLAAEGLRANIAIAQGGYSLPSYATMLTGLYPTEHGLFRYPAQLPADLPTLAEKLGAVGYRSACIGGNPFFNEFFGITRGFDSVQMYERINIAPPISEDGALASIEPRQWPSFLANCGLSCLGLRDKGGAGINRLVEQFATASDSQWFCFIHYMEVHSPYWPPLRHRLAQQESLTGLLSGVRYARHVFDDGLTAAAGRAPMRLRSDLYDGGVAYTDELIGRLLRSLYRRGQLNNTVVVVCSDHGEMMGEEGLFRHEVGFGETLVRVPLVIWAPDYIAPGRVDEGVVELRDVTHSLTGVAEADGPAAGAREPHVLFADGEIDPERVALSEWVRSDVPHISANSDYRALMEEKDRTARLLRHRDWQFIEYEDGEQVLERMPPAAPADAEDYERRLEWFGDRMAETVANLQPASGTGSAEEMPAEVAGRLRQLGYF